MNRPRVAALSVALLAVATAPLAASEKATLKVATEVEGTPATGCQLKVLNAGGLLQTPEPPALAEGPADAPLELDAGRVDLVATCTVQRVVYVAAATGLTLRSGRETAHTFKLHKGSIIVHAIKDGARIATGEYVLLLPGTQMEVARATVGSRMYAAAGRYDIRVEVEVEGDRPEVWLEDQELATGRPKVVQADVSPGMLELVVLRNGTPGEGAGAVTLPGRAHRIKEFSTGDPVPLSPGTYDVLASLSSSFDFTEMRKRKVVIRPGKVATVKMNLVRGTVTTRCVLDGKEPVAEVEGYIPGAAEYFNQAPCGQVLELSPGKYHFKFSINAEKSGWRVLGDAPPPSVWQRNIKVRGGKDTAVTVDFSPAHLTVNSRKNGEAVDAAVTVMDVRGNVLGGGPSGSDLPVPPGRYDVEVLFPGKRGPAKEVLRGVPCKVGKPCIVGADIERAVVVVEVFYKGKPAPDAQVAVFKLGADVPYVKGRSAEELEVPPGDWVPEVRLEGKRQQVSRMRLKAGDHETRRVEVVDAK